MREYVVLLPSGEQIAHPDGGDLWTFAEFVRWQQSGGDLAAYVRFADNDYPEVRGGRAKGKADRRLRAKAPQIKPAAKRQSLPERREDHAPLSGIPAWLRYRKPGD